MSLSRTSPNDFVSMMRIISHGMGVKVPEYQYDGTTATVRWGGVSISYGAQAKQVAKQACANLLHQHFKIRTLTSPYHAVIRNWQLEQIDGLQERTAMGIVYEWEGKGVIDHPQWHTRKLENGDYLAELSTAIKGSVIVGPNQAFRGTGRTIRMAKKNAAQAFVQVAINYV